MDEDDIFYEDEDKNEEKIIFKNNLNRLIEPIRQEGFREGFANGREESFQSGFDEGYSEGFHVGFSMGTYNSLLKTLHTHKFDVPSTLDLDVTELKPFDNPTRGMCYICTDAGVLLNKEDIGSNLEKSANIPLDEIISKQKQIIDDAVSEKKDLSCFKKVVDNLGVQL